MSEYMIKIRRALEKHVLSRIRPRPKYELLSAGEIIALYESTEKDVRSQLRYRCLRAFPVVDAQKVQRLVNAVVIESEERMTVIAEEIQKKLNM